jgi:seryl-tRNA synthetase
VEGSTQSAGKPDTIGNVPQIISAVLVVCAFSTVAQTPPSATPRQETIDELLRRHGTAGSIYTLKEDVLALRRDVQAKKIHIDALQQQIDLLQKEIGEMGTAQQQMARDAMEAIKGLQGESNSLMAKSDEPKEDA